MLKRVLMPIAALLLHATLVQAAETELSKSVRRMDHSPTRQVIANDNKPVSERRNYQQIGKLIYGSVRFDGELTTLSRWFSGENLAYSEDADLNLEERIRLSDIYFSEHPAKAAHHGEFLQVVRTLHRLQKDRFAIVQHENIDEHIGEYLMTLRDAHLQLAEIVEKLGCSEIDPNRLREQAKRF